MQGITADMTLTAAVVALAIVAAWNTVWAGFKNFREAKKPSEDLRAQVESHAEMLDRDNRRLRELEDSQRLLLKSMSQLLEHNITGNDVVGLKTVRDEINDYLINR